MREVYYHLKGVKGSTITVCLLLGEDKEIEARGVAICSPIDQFCKRVGRDISRGRAYKAIGLMETSRPIKKGSTHGHLEGVRLMFGHKAAYRPVPNEVEKTIVNKIGSTKEIGLTTAGALP